MEATALRVDATSVPPSGGRAPSVLAVGYNGANNTGAEALLLTDIADMRSVLGPDVRITVPTLNAANLRRYVQEGPGLAITPVPTVFFRRVRELVAKNDVTLLVEGSTYMDTWTPALLWYFLWATRCANKLGKPCLAYAVDAGEKSSLNRRLTRRLASETDLIVTRSAGQRSGCVLGVTAPIEVTADNAFRFVPDPADAGWLEQAGRRASARASSGSRWSTSTCFRSWCGHGVAGGLLPLALLLLSLPAAPPGARSSPSRMRRSWIGSSPSTTVPWL